MRVLRRDPPHDPLIRTPQARQRGGEERVESRLALHDRHLLEICPRLPRPHEHLIVEHDRLTGGTDAPRTIRFEHPAERRKTQALRRQRVREVARDHRSERVSDHRERRLADRATDLGEHRIRELARGALAGVSSALRPRKIEVDALPPPVREVAVERQHDAVIHPETVNRDERGSLAEDLRNHRSRVSALRTPLCARRAPVPVYIDAMSTDPTPSITLDHVRQQIDTIDQRIVALIAERQRWVLTAGTLKQNEGEVRAPARVEQVIDKVRGLAERDGASPEVVEAAYRALIAAFIDLELRQHRAPCPPGLGATGTWRSRHLLRQ